MKRIAISSHTALIGGKEYDGIGNVLIETMSSIPADFIFVRHSMDGKLSSVVRSYVNGMVKNEHKLLTFNRPAPLRYLTELTSTMWHFTIREKVDSYIGIDPLNALAAVFLKKLHRIDYCIFFTPDYSPKRFNSKLLNNLYHIIDKYCVANADEVWSVSTRIQAVRREQGLEDRKNILVPNVPPEKYSYLKKNEKNIFRLITYGVIDKQLDFIGTLEAIKILEKELPKLEFVIIGNGPSEKLIKEKAAGLKLSSKVKLLGHKTLTNTLEEASKSGIGLSLYTGEWGFNQYGDSTKCREYAFFGLPIITTDTHSTVDEIRETGSGIIVKKDPVEYAKAIVNIINDYTTYSKNSTSLGKKYSGTHYELLRKILR